MPSSTKLYNDLSGYYDLMCADIDYPEQSSSVRRLDQLFGNGGRRHLDLACGTGPHIRHFLDFGYQCQGLDINQPMLDKAKARCPEAGFTLGDIGSFAFDQSFDLITCFLYSIHYNRDIHHLNSCIASVYEALQAGGVFCFNAVDKNKINNNLFVTHSAEHRDGVFKFSSGWQYRGYGEQQSLKLRIQKSTQDLSKAWEDEHPMVAVGFEELIQLLEPWFEVHVFEHDYGKIEPWDGQSGNALFVCVKA
ncbi:class I SAM-dependent DNA methyltransferase [Marinobacter salicampi]|uniref:class I SAM-dependent DNA methyltransferase n=1 Tax=Marinobacter salicampi TaxID=435907 RepID=UPI00140ABA99|nr:class I SAM-dependent methyltransferase [Marinobacter salicampi]